jgi:hypothetical protein
MPIFAASQRCFSDALTAFDPAGAAGDRLGAVWREAPDGWRGVLRHRGPVLAVAGELSAGADGRVFAGETLIATHRGPAIAVASIEGVVWSAGADGSVWAADRFIQAHEGPVAALVAHTRGVLTAGLDGRVLQLHRDGVRERARAPVAIDALAAHGDDFAAGLSDGGLLVSDARGVRIERLGDSPVFFVARGADGWVAATTDGRVHAGGRSFATGREGVFAIALDPDGARVWVAVGGAARAWSLADGAPAGVLAPCDAGMSSGGLSVNPESVWVWTERLTRWPRPEPTATADHAGRVRGVCRAGDHLISWANDGCVVIRGPDRALRRVIVAHAGIVWAAAVSPDGARLATGSDREVALWSLATGARLGHWTTPGHAVAWHGDTLVAGGGDVRLAALEDGGLVRVRGHAGPGFAQQTQRIVVEPDGSVLTGSTVGTDGWRFSARDDAPRPATLPKAPPPDAAMTLAEDGSTLRGSPHGTVGDAVESPEVPLRNSPAPQGAPPPWPAALGPAWLQAWLAAGKCTPATRPALHAALDREGLPLHEAVLAWEVSVGGWTCGGVTIGSEARRFEHVPRAATLPNGDRGLLVAQDWPSHFYGDSQGIAWEQRLARWSRVGPLRALLPLLALRHAAGAPFATLEAGTGQAEALARALGAEPVELDTRDRWWLGDGVLIDEDATRARAAVSDVQRLVAAARASAGATVRAASPKVTERPLIEAPEGTSGLAIDAGRKPSLVQRIAVDGVLVEELVARGATPKLTRWVQVSGAEPSALSPFARAWLAARKATRDPRDTSSPEALRGRITARGYIPHEAALRAEALVGGLRFPDPRHAEEPWFSVGAWQSLGLWPLGWSLDEASRAAGAVPLASGPGDDVWMVFPDGSIGWQEKVAMPRPVLQARDALPWLERLIRERANPVPIARRPGRHGHAFAAALGCAPVPEATDALGAWWTGDGVSVSETLDAQAALDGDASPGVVTCVRADKSAAKRVRNAIR